jgi:hypothetical protein
MVRPLWSIRDVKCATSTASSATPSARRTAGIAVISAGVLALGVGPLRAQAPAALPFESGEHLTYQVKVGRLPGTGRGSLRVEGPVEVRGRSVLRLYFDFEARVGPIKAMDHTESWLDVERMAAMRFRKREHHPLSRNDRLVDLFPDERRWETVGGTGGKTASDAPLDELSFVYFMRQLPLHDDSVYSFDRHFEIERNPVTLRVVGRETVKTKAGEFRTIVVEMHVRDQARYRKSGGVGVIRFFLSDDTRRIPVRIESAVPVFGTAVFTLLSASMGSGETPAPEF